MNNMQHIVKDSTRYAMHVAVELCEQGDFDSVTDAFRWLMQECDDSELVSGTCQLARPTDLTEGCAALERIAELKAERDELKKRVDEQQETLDVDCCDLIENDNEICRLTAERDQLTNAINELQKKQPYCYNPEQPLDTLNTIGRYIDELRAECDEWKANAMTFAGYSKHWRERCAKLEHRSARRAEVLERVKNLRGSDCDGYALLDAMFGEAPNDGTWKIDSDIDKLIDLLTDDNGVTNLEWLFENDYETLCDQMGGQPCSCCVVGCKEDLGSDEACAKALREWLMAPHEDVHPKAQSKTEQLLTEQSESSSDEADSREKLESDIQSELAALSEYGKLMLDWYVVMDWLDRQAAITANETSHDNPYVGLVRGKQWERTEMSDYYCGKCGWKVTDHDSFCPECGGALHGGSGNSSERVAAVER